MKRRECTQIEASECHATDAMRLFLQGIDAAMKNDYNKIFIFLFIHHPLY
jgi:hypothetical protein